MVKGEDVAVGAVREDAGIGNLGAAAGWEVRGGNHAVLFVAEGEKPGAVERQDVVDVAVVALHE